MASDFDPRGKCPEPSEEWPSFWVREDRLTAIPINFKMMGALMYMLDFLRDLNPPLLAGLRAKHGDDAVDDALARLYYLIERRALPVPEADVERQILKICVEDSIWLRPYVEHGPTAARLEEARATLRELARILDTMGVEVFRIPFD